MREHVEATLASIRAQTWPHIDVVIVNDGSLAQEDADLWAMAEERDDMQVVLQANRGLGAARNLGVRCATGRFILPLDPDNELEPEFVERCLHALRSRPELGFVTTWSHYMDESGTLLPLPDHGYTPLGNWSPLVDGDNVAGDGTALLRRAVFDIGHRYDIELTSFEDWFFYRELHHAGVLGDVIPERLFRYRVRTDSMLRTVGLRNSVLIHDEMRARLKEREVSWTPKNG
jgi:glycosyltransferase involved in cell wall biosynthesis